MESMKNEITAEEAKQLAGPTPQERVEEVLSKIKLAAKNKQRSLNLTDEWWSYAGYEGEAKRPDYAECCKLLRDRGFQIDFFYEERQFVNMYVIIKW